MNSYISFAYEIIALLVVTHNVLIWPHSVVRFNICEPCVILECYTRNDYQTLFLVLSFKNNILWKFWELSWYKWFGGNEKICVHSLRSSKVICVLRSHKICSTKCAISVTYVNFANFLLLRATATKLSGLLYFHDRVMSHGLFHAIMLNSLFTIIAPK